MISFDALIAKSINPSLSNRRIAVFADLDTTLEPTHKARPAGDANVNNVIYIGEAPVRLGLLSMTLRG